MPASHGLRLDEHEGIIPPRPEQVERNPESSIGRCEARARLLLGVYRELLLQGELDDGLLSSSSDQGRQCSEENGYVRHDGACHEDSLPARIWGSRDEASRSVLGRFSCMRPGVTP